MPLWWTHTCVWSYTCLYYCMSMCDCMLVRYGCACGVMGSFIIYTYVFRRYLLNKNLDLHGSVIYALGQSFYKYLRKTYIYINCVKSKEYILLAVVVIKLDVTQLKPPTKRNTIYLVVQSRGLNPLPLASFNGSDHKS